MKDHKLNMTRPEFLKKFLTDSDDISSITNEDIARILPGSEKVMYCAYTVLRDHDLPKHSIQYVNFDGDSIAMRLESKQLAKQIKDEWNDHTLVRIGAMFYSVNIKIDKTYLIVTIDEDHRIDENNE